ncbi:hypothetical protein K458DRAFT_480422 [Lentithecium fluviatile CBS 122367]|uniref:UbiA prenyltransferase n=1 Tax=Lentithecium fluviatile CBS 122367 TaxID=1168545 RepID=A0A6G1IMX3_9PLEO|nr:hypothetical protein K458DRAFT_480422 [Lentithecium fluviatile CBS 122367]
MSLSIRKCISELARLPTTASQTTRKLTNKVLYHGYTIWLFTQSDLKTIIVPSSVFGLIGALSGPPLLTGSLPNEAILFRAPHVLLWTWSTLLPFAINNQCQEDAITEDRHNKPWRPLPSKRIAPSSATWLMLLLYIVNLLLSPHLGGFWQSISMLFLGTWYNRLGGADRSAVEKNFINAAGYISFVSGALSVAISDRNSGVGFGAIAIPWFLCIGLVILTTVHTQDFQDVDGDAARGRITVPLAIGDGVARLTVALAVPFWSLFIPWYFQSHLLGWVGPIILATVVSYRISLRRNKTDDKVTFVCWNLWIVSLYAVPFYIYG